LLQFWLFRDKRQGGQRLYVFVRGELEAVGEQSLKHASELFPCCFLRGNRDNVVPVHLQPGWTTQNGVCIDSVGSGNQIEHGCLPQFIPIAAKDTACGVRGWIYLARSDANIGGLEPLTECNATQQQCQSD
jgi:hypothetical protein